MNLKGVALGTWIRLIALFLAWLNTLFASIFGYQLLPFTDEEIYEGVSIIVTLAVTIWTSWKNNSFTEEAQQADQYLKTKKGN